MTIRMGFLVQLNEIYHREHVMRVTSTRLLCPPEKDDAATCKITRNTTTKGGRAFSDDRALAQSSVIVKDCGQYALRFLECRN